MTIPTMTITPVSAWATGSANTVTVSLSDGDSGVSVALTSNSANGVVSSSPVVTNGSGDAVFTVTPDSDGGTFTLTASAPGYPDATLAVDVAAQGAAPWFEEDWDYADTADFLSDPNGWLSPDGTLEKVLVQDPTAPWPSQKCFEVRFVAGGPTSAGVDVFFPRASEDQPREIWQETWIRWSSNWKTNFNGSGNPDHKTILWFDQNSSGSRRWSFKAGVFSSAQIRTYTSNVDDDPGRLSSATAPEILWDNEWHRIRVHFRMQDGGPNGIIESWIDDLKMFELFDVFNPDQRDFDYFNKTALGRNLNQTPDQDQQIRYGRTRVYLNDPGW